MLNSGEVNLSMSMRLASTRRGCGAAKQRSDLTMKPIRRIKYTLPIDMDDADIGINYSTFL